MPCAPSSIAAGSMPSCSRPTSATCRSAPACSGSRSRRSSRKPPRRDRRGAVRPARHGMAGSITQDKKMTLSGLRPLLPFVAAMIVVVGASNYLVQFPFGHFGLDEVLTWGAFTYPVAFLVNDLTNRRFGLAAARRVVLAGFILAVMLSAWLATPRIAIASGAAFLV